MLRAHAVAPVKSTEGWRANALVNGTTHRLVRDNWNAGFHCGPTAGRLGVVQGGQRLLYFPPTGHQVVELTLSSGTLVIRP